MSTISNEQLNEMERDVKDVYRDGLSRAEQEYLIQAYRELAGERNAEAENEGVPQLKPIVDDLRAKLEASERREKELQEKLESEVARADAWEFNSSVQYESWKSAEKREKVAMRALENQIKMQLNLSGWAQHKLESFMRIALEQAEKEIDESTI